MKCFHLTFFMIHAIMFQKKALFYRIFAIKPYCENLFLFISRRRSKNTLREFSIVRLLDFKGPGGFPSGPLAVYSLFIHLFLFSSLFFSWKLLPRRR